MDNRLDNILKKAHISAVNNKEQRELQQKENMKDNKEQLDKEINTFLNKARRNRSFTCLEIFKFFTNSIIKSDGKSKDPSMFDMIWYPTSYFDVHAGVDRYLPIIAKNNGKIPKNERIVFFDANNKCGFKENYVGSYDAEKFEKLGFHVTNNGEIGIQYADFAEILKKAANNELKEFNDEVINLLKDTNDKLERINTFIDDCNRNTDLLYLSICKKMISNYTKNPNVSYNIDYEVTVPYISRQDYKDKLIKDSNNEELKVLDLLPNEWTICYIRRNKKRVPILYDKLESMFENITCTNEWHKNQMYLYINSLELEKLLINQKFDNEKRH